MEPSQFLQLLFSGLTSGGVYAMVGVGFTLVYRTSRIINFAQGEFYVLGAFLMITMVDVWHLPRWAAFVAAVALTGAVAAVLQRATFAIIPEKDLLPRLMITVAWIFLLQGGMSMVWGKTPLTLSRFPGPLSLDIFGGTIAFQTLWVLVTVLAATLLLTLFVSHTRLGKALLACAENEIGAKLVGISIERATLAAFVCSAALGAAAGMVAAPLSYVSYTTGLVLTTKGFAAAVVGGIDNAYGALVGGLLLGLVEAFSAGLFSSLFYQLISIIALLVILVGRPSGLLRGRH